MIHLCSLLVPLHMLGTQEVFVNDDSIVLKHEECDMFLDSSGIYSWQFPYVQNKEGWWGVNLNFCLPYNRHITDQRWLSQRKEAFLNRKGEKKKMKDLSCNKELLVLNLSGQDFEKQHSQVYFCKKPWKGALQTWSPLAFYYFPLIMAYKSLILENSTHYCEHEKQTRFHKADVPLGK